MAQIIDGKRVSSQMRQDIRDGALRCFAKTGIRPGLAVILVGEDPASQIYVRNKKKACEEVGFFSREILLPEDVTEERLLSEIDRLNALDTIHGILVQLPVPPHLNPKHLIERIAPHKDVDAFSYESVGRLVTGNPLFLPCTPAGILALLDAYAIPLAGKRAVVIGRSNIVGKPMAHLLLSRDATVTVCHSKTEHLQEICRTADVLVSAVGKAGFVRGEMIKPDAVVIDVGMNRAPDGHLCGDVLFDEAKEKASYLTPVPGGVGPMTITMLLQNTLTAARLASQKG